MAAASAAAAAPHGAGARRGLRGARAGARPIYSGGGGARGARACSRAAPLRLRGWEGGGERAAAHAGGGEAGRMRERACAVGAEEPACGGAVGREGSSSMIG